MIHERAVRGRIAVRPGTIRHPRHPRRRQLIAFRGWITTPATPGTKREPTRITTIAPSDGKESMVLAEPGRACGSRGLVDRYRAIFGASRLEWTEPHRLVRRLGEGGQGVVFLAERWGADGFRLQVALKVFSPERY